MSSQQVEKYNNNSLRKNIISPQPTVTQQKNTGNNIDSSLEVGTTFPLETFTPNKTLLLSEAGDWSILVGFEMLLYGRWFYLALCALFGGREIVKALKTMNGRWQNLRILF